MPMANGQTVTVDMGAVQQHRPDHHGLGGQHQRLRPRLPGEPVHRRHQLRGAPSPPAPVPRALVTATFPAANARYVRVTQTGTSTSWWSIAEFNAYTNGRPVAAAGRPCCRAPDGSRPPRCPAPPTYRPGCWTATPRPGGAPACRWRTGRPSPWTSARRTAWSQITMDSAGSVNDYAHGYQVSLSTDGVDLGLAGRHRRRHRRPGDGHLPGGQRPVHPGHPDRRLVVLVVDRRVQRLLVATGRTTAILVRAARPVVLRVPTSTRPYR